MLEVRRLSNAFPNVIREASDGSQRSGPTGEADRGRARRRSRRTPHAARRAEPAGAHLALRVTCRRSRTAGQRQCVRVVRMLLRRVQLMSRNAAQSYKSVGRNY